MDNVQQTITLYNVPPEAKVDIKRWAAITIEKWQYNLIKMRVKGTGTLLNSFTASVSADADGNLALINFAFQDYLRMIDMGVGKGVTYEDAQDGIGSRRAYGTRKGNRRRPKKVYLNTLYSEVYRLSELVAKEYADRGARAALN